MAYDIRSAVRSALAIPRDVVGGTADYIRENNAAHAQALSEVKAKQKTMVGNTMRTAGNNAPTPMGENELYSKVDDRTQQIKKSKNISLVGSIKKRLANPND